MLGIGDDAAAWQPSRSHLSVITSDALVDGVHFDSAAMPASAIGRRAMVSNLSDVAAMGARPVLATVALGLPPAFSRHGLLECYRGLAAVAAEARCPVVGGDLVRAPALTLALSVVGEVARPRLKRRSGGRPGDVLAVTGALGASRAGLELMRRSLDVDAAVRDAARAAFEAPVARLAEGRFLGASANVRAMMDCSDGLATDAGRLARAGGCGALVEHVPVHPAAEAVARAAGDDGERYALDGGEDFELLVAVAPRAFAHLARRFETRFGRPLLAVGRLDASRDLRIGKGSATRELVPAGFDHLREG